MVEIVSFKKVQSALNNPAYSLDANDVEVTIPAETSRPVAATGDTGRNAQEPDVQNKRCCQDIRGHSVSTYVLLAMLLILAGAVGGLAGALIAMTSSSTAASTTTTSVLPTTTSTTSTTKPTTTTIPTSTTKPTVATTILPTTTALPTTTNPPSPTTTLPDMTDAEKARVDCWPQAKYGGDPVDFEDCRNMGCTWDASPRPDVPACYVSDRDPLGFGYQVTDMDWVNFHETGFTIKMVSKAGPRSAKANSGQSESEFVIFEATYYDEDLLNFKFYRNVSDNYKVPDEALKLNLPIPSFHPTRRPRYEIKITSYIPFTFQIIRTSNGRVLWDTDVGGLVVTDQFNAISTKLPSEFIYGLGENRHRSFKHETDFQTWGMFARDQPVSQGNYNLYGVHPFYSCMEMEGLTHGVLLLNSNAMEYSLSPLPVLTYRTTGGILDFYMFLGPAPETVVQQYTELVGRPFLPPYWALGFQQCRYGYNNLQNLTNAVERTLGADIPLDVQYADIDHYDQRKVFTIDDEAYHGLPEYFQSLREKGMRTVIILDPTFKINEAGYEPYLKGLENDIYIKWPSKDVMPPADFDETNTTAMLGYVWPNGKVVFPDFLHPKASDVWSELIAEHRTKIPFDGLWVDMNEPANFGTNDDKPWNWPDGEPSWSLKCPNNPWEDPPYRTVNAFAYDEETQANRGENARLSDKTLCMSAVQGNGTYRHYDVHSLYGTTTVPPTLSALRAASGERGLVVSRSTFVGSGRLAGHWLGDNFATWSDLKDSIVGMLEFNLFGIPYIGADICGFFGDTNANLCKRWLQLGAFYPYSRTHNDINSAIENDPASFNEEVTAVAKEAITTRYELLPYLYTLFYNAHVYGSTVVRPLHHEFPTDLNVRSISNQFMWGKAILFAPIIEEDRSDAIQSFYLPAGMWFDYRTSRVAYKGSGRIFGVTFYPQSPMPIYIRGGNILAIQDSANNTYFSRQKPFHLRVYLDEFDTFAGAKASGELYWDDGVSIDPYENNNYYHATYVFEQKTLKVNILHNGIDEMDSALLADVAIMGVVEVPNLILVNGEYEHHDFTYSVSERILYVNHLDIKMSEDVVLEYIYSRLPTEEERQRVDCMPDGVSAGATYECESRGCIWAKTVGPPGVPRCYVDREAMNYNYMSEELSSFNRRTLIELNHTGRGSVMPDPVRRLQVAIEQRESNILRIKIAPETNVETYEVPIYLNLDFLNSPLLEKEFDVEYEKDPAKGFYVKVKRSSTGIVVWDSTIGGLSFSDQYLQISTTVPSTRLYGLGEHRHQTFKHSFDYKTWPLFAREEPPTTDERNLYGVHPYYTCVEDDEGHAHGVLLMNSNAMEIALQPTPAVTYRTTGGILDFYIFFGDDAEMVTRLYQWVIGRPFLPPYWSLGFQMARSGYGNTDGIRQMRQRMESTSIPQDVQYIDIEYTDENKAFTVNQENFGDLGDYVAELKNISNIRTIIRLDPAVYASDQHEPYVNGDAENVFITWPEGMTNPDQGVFANRYVHGYAWPKGPVVYPDFHNNAAKAWWKTLIKSHHNTIDFDGLYLYTNEPSSYSSPKWDGHKLNNWSPICPTNNLDDPPYKPATLFGARLSDQTICMTGQQSSGFANYSHYDVHNIYGLLQARPSLEAVGEANGERGLVISRSTFPSSGTMVGHSLGDNEADWESLRYSIIGILEFNIFAIPYVGADICGYEGSVGPELCIRWLQLGAFYPLSRSNSALGSQEKGPADFGPIVSDAARKVFGTRYMLLPYLYTQFYYVNTRGGTIVRPLFHEFPGEPLTYDIDDQFLWGPALMVCPVLTENTFELTTYIPEGRWFEYYFGSELKQTGHFRHVKAPLDYIPLFVRGGHIIVEQQTDVNTHLSRKKFIHLLIAPNENGTASGEFFYDDGVSIDTVARRQYCLWHFELYTTSTGHAVKFTVKQFNLYSEDTDEILRIDEVRVLGLPSIPRYVSVRHQHIYPAPHDKWLFNENNKELLIHGIRDQLYLYGPDNEWTLFWGW